MHEWIVASHEAVLDGGGSAFRASETLGDILENALAEAAASGKRCLRGLCLWPPHEL